MVLVQERPSASARAAEADIRADLAACYRLAALFGWDDHIATHISARLPDDLAGKHVFLINPYGLMFDEVTASSLVKINEHGDILEPSDHPVNHAGFVAHSAVHLARDDIHWAIHLHTRDGVAVSMTQAGLLPLNQSAMLVTPEIAFHEYEGAFDGLDERARIASDLGDKNILMLRNHGTMAMGRTAAEAFMRIYYLEWSCSVQVRAMSMAGATLRQPPAQVQKEVEGFMDDDRRSRYSQMMWAAFRRKLDRIDPGYKD